MKIVAINGSPHGMKGNTGLLLKSLLLGAEEAGAEVELFALSKLDIKYCKGCHTCSKTGTCVHDDGMVAITKAVEQADGYVFASPNQVSGVSGQTKVFIDRLMSPIDRQVGRNRYGAVLMASGGPMFELPEAYLALSLRVLGAWNVGSVGVCQPQLDDEEEREEILTAATDLGKQLVEAIENKTTYKDQEDEREQIFETMRFLSEMRKDEAPFDYEYWQTHWS